MRKFDTYLAQLQKALSTFSPSEQDDIVAEIQGHIEEGLHDPQMGLSAAERVKKINSELGSPADLAKGLYKAHWRKRWLFLVTSAIGYVIIATVIWRPLPLIAMTIFWVSLALPIIIGLALEYCHRYQNSLLST